jgi:hypothetical protein
MRHEIGASRVTSLLAYQPTNRGGASYISFCCNRILLSARKHRGKTPYIFRTNMFTLYTRKFNAATNLWVGVHGPYATSSQPAQSMTTVTFVITFSECRKRSSATYIHNHVDMQTRVYFLEADHSHLVTSPT